MIKITEQTITIKKGLSDREVAILCGVTRQTVFNWRKGKTRPLAKHLKALKKLSK
jgi:transcriptional regulator with XRE-family HTH domain